MNFQQEVIDMTIRHIKLNNPHTNLTDRELMVLEQGAILGFHMGAYSGSSEEIQRYVLDIADNSVQEVLNQRIKNNN